MRRGPLGIFLACRRPKKDKAAMISPTTNGVMECQSIKSTSDHLTDRSVASESPSIRTELENGVMSGSTVTRPQSPGPRSLLKTCAKMIQTQKFNWILTEWITRTTCCVVC